MTPLHTDVVTLLAEVWELSPDVRLGQLLAHLGFLGEAHLDKGLSDLEDDQLVSLLELHRKELRARLGSSDRSASPLPSAATSIEGTSSTPVVEVSV
jgi:uncharacterized protein YihD (DUF1040 family)